MNVTCVSFHNFVDTGEDPRVTDGGWSCITNRGRGIGKWAGAWVCGQGQGTCAGARDGLEGQGRSRGRGRALSAITPV